MDAQQDTVSRPRTWLGFAVPFGLGFLVWSIPKPVLGIEELWDWSLVVYCFLFFGAGVVVGAAWEKLFVPGLAAWAGQVSAALLCPWIAVEIWIVFLATTASGGGCAVIGAAIGFVCRQALRSFPSVQVSLKTVLVLVTGGCLIFAAVNWQLGKLVQLDLATRVTYIVWMALTVGYMYLAAIAALSAHHGDKAQACCGRDVIIACAPGVIPCAAWAAGYLLMWYPDTHIGLAAVIFYCSVLLNAAILAPWVLWHQWSRPQSTAMILKAVSLTAAGASLWPLVMSCISFPAVS